MENTLIVVKKSELTEIIQNAVQSIVFENSGKQNPDKAKSFIRGIHGLAKFLGVSPTRAQKLKNDGVISCWQDGRTVLFDPEKVVDELMHKSKHTGHGI